MSIGKSSLARAAAAAGTRPAPVAETAPVVTGLQEVAVEAISAATGDKLPVRADQGLVSSIAEKGLLEPLLLAQPAPGQLVLLAGGRRLAAAKKAGLSTVPAVIREMSATEAAACRKELKRFAAPATKTAKAETPAATSAATAVGQSMPDWLL